MSKVILYIATSLDNCIARKNGDVSWLFTDQDYGYEEFYQSIDTIIMGRNTYDHVLNFGDYPYKKVKSYILTHRPESLSLPPSGSVYAGDISELITEVKKESKKNIWLVGGAHVSQDALNKGLVDELWLFVHPIILGSGLRLYEHIRHEVSLELQRAKRFETGLVQLVYSVKPHDHA
jgi:dihydrofolate reductase